MRALFTLSSQLQFSSCRHCHWLLCLPFFFFPCIFPPCIIIRRHFKYWPNILKYSRAVNESFVYIIFTIAVFFMSALSLVALSFIFFFPCIFPPCIILRRHFKYWLNILKYSRAVNESFVYIIFTIAVFFISALSLVALSSILNIFPLIFSSIVIRIHIFGGKDCDHLCLAHSRQEGQFLMAVVAFIVILFVIIHK